MVGRVAVTRSVPVIRVARDFVLTSEGSLLVEELGQEPVSKNGKRTSRRN